MATVVNVCLGLNRAVQRQRLGDPGHILFLGISVSMGEEEGRLGKEGMGRGKMLAGPWHLHLAQYPSAI
jgi:hypothetical protein